jgi:Uma2 family endonuclease
MLTAERMTSADLALLPDDGKHYELIEGELFMSRQPSWEHQFSCGQFFRYLQGWSEKTKLGVAIMAPGVLFADDDDVAPDVVWISKERLQMQNSIDKSGHLLVAPELVIEVLSPGLTNELRDKQAKLKLYSRRGVKEYWVADWMRKQIEVYRREQGALKLTATLFADDDLTSPLLPGFSCKVIKMFFTLFSLTDSEQD